MLTLGRVILLPSHIGSSSASSGSSYSFFVPAMESSLNSSKTLFQNSLGASGRSPPPNTTPLPKVCPLHIHVSSTSFQAPLSWLRYLSAHFFLSDFRCSDHTNSPIPPFRHASFAESSFIFLLVCCACPSWPLSNCGSFAQISSCTSSFSQFITSSGIIITWVQYLNLE